MKCLIFVPIMVINFLLDTFDFIMILCVCVCMFHSFKAPKLGILAPKLREIAESEPCNAIQREHKN